MRSPNGKKKLGKANQSQMSATNEEVAQVLGISRQAVSEMEHRIFRKVRKLLIAKGIKAKDILPDD